jgi:outer membrane protein assembly factor BamD
MRSWWLVSLALLAACAHATRVPEIQDTDQALAQARAQFRHGDFAGALLAFRRVQFELNPGQQVLPEVRYLLAECAFQTGDMAGAALAFQKVAEEFPTSEYAALALLRTGDANLRLWRRPEVDPTPGQVALASYQELVGRYPGTDAAARGQLHVRQLNARFAERDYKTGIFYFRRRAYDSAIIYFKSIIASYPDTPQVPDALLRLVDSYRAIAYPEELKETCAHLRRYYPHAEGLDRRCPADASAGTP